EAPADSLIHELLHVRYGAADGLALSAYRALEDVVRQYGSIPYTRLKSAASLDSAMAVLKMCKSRVDAANLPLLGAMLDYAIGDLAVLKLKASGAPGATVEARVRELVDMLQQHAGKGLFVLREKDNLRIYISHYNNLK
ncbi:MAG TPA: hypothetical protein VGM31_11840, partial [Puia sp.]